eukprot:234043_1
MTIFLINLSCYDQIDTKTDSNKMNRTIKLYQWFLKDYSLYLKKHTIKYGYVLLIFDKIKQFKNKLINNIPLTECIAFDKYNGANDYIQCKEYILNKFKRLNLYSNVKIDLYFNDENNSHCLKKISHF